MVDFSAVGTALPVYDKSALPRPVLPGRDGWLALWDLAWELLFRNVKDPGIPGWKPYLGSDVCFVDLACQQALSARCIADLARALGDGAKAVRYEAEYDRIRGLVDRFHWCPRDRFYHDFFARDRPVDRVKFLGTKTAAAFWALAAGIARGDRLRAMADHLFDPAEFYTPVPFASLSRDDLDYDPDGGYWLGSV